MAESDSSPQRLEAALRTRGHRSTKVSLRRSPRRPGFGHLRSSNRSGNRRANDRYSKYSGHTMTAAQTRPLSKAVARHLGGPVEIRCKSNAPSSFTRTDAADPSAIYGPSNSSLVSGPSGSAWPRVPHSEQAHTTAPIALKADLMQTPLVSRFDVTLAKFGMAL